MNYRNHSKILCLLPVDLSSLGRRTTGWKALVSSIKRRMIGLLRNIELLSRGKVANVAKLEVMSLHMSWRPEEIHDEPQAWVWAFRLTWELSIPCEWKSELLSPEQTFSVERTSFRFSRRTKRLWRCGVIRPHTRCRALFCGLEYREVDGSHGVNMGFELFMWPH